jgi:hypothetical protein
MKKYYTTEQMVEFLNDIYADGFEDADHEGIVEEISTRLATQQTHIRHLLDRLALSEKVIGELYLMQREYEE